MKEIYSPSTYMHILHIDDRINKWIFFFFLKRQTLLLPWLPIKSIPNLTLVDTYGKIHLS